MKFSKSILFGVAFLLITVAPADSNVGSALKVYRVFNDFRTDFDPGRLTTIFDLELYSALSRTLARFDVEKREPVLSLASDMRLVDAKTIELTLPESAVWSDGSRVTAAQVVSSLQRSLRKYPQLIPGMVELTERIEVAPRKGVSDSSEKIRFFLKAAGKEKEYLDQLTKPMTAIFRVMPDDRIDFSASTGPFVISPETLQALAADSIASELMLIPNTRWPLASKISASKVLIRKRPVGVVTGRVMLDDPWPSFVDDVSIPKSSFDEHREKGLSLHVSNYSEVLFFQLGQALSNPSGFALLRKLRAALERTKPQMTEFMDPGHYEFTQHLLPPSYYLHSKAACQQSSESEEWNAEKIGSLRLLFARGRSEAYREGVIKAFVSAFGVAPHAQVLSPPELPRELDSDVPTLFFASNTIHNEEPESLISFFVSQRKIASFENDLSSRMSDIRQRSSYRERGEALRLLLKDALCDGRILPMFFVSRLYFGRPNIDWSGMASEGMSLHASSIFTRVRLR